MDAAKWTLKWAMGGLLAGAGAAAYAQHAHYMHTRREVLGDRTPLLHSGSARHCVVLLRTKGGDVADSVRILKYAAEAGGALLVYAGKARQTMLVSTQLPKEWDGFVILQFRSHEHACEVRGSAAYAAALAGLAANYHVEFAQPPILNVLLPQFLLFLRLRQFLKGERILPFIEASREQHEAAYSGENGPPGRQGKVFDDLGSEYLDQTVLDNEPAVQLNLVRAGTAEEKKSDRAYGLKMANLFAAARTGPVYVGRATWWEGKDDGVHWDEVAIAHYPSRRFFVEMAKSTFFNAIVGEKKMRDTLVVAATPCKL